MMSTLRSWLSNHGDTVRNIGFYLILILLVIWIISSRIFELETVPAGLYFDESSIGYNAITILRSGEDEYGIRYPVYFKSVGDYKNPIYIYAAASVFNLLGISEFTLRFTSVLFFGVALFFWILLIGRLFEGRRTVIVFGLIAFGFSPLFFVISRISFEIISQLAIVSALNLTIWMTFSKLAQAGLWDREAVVCGFLLGLSTYSYTTQRFLSGLILAVLWLVFFNRENSRRLLLISTVFFLTLIPLFYFASNNPGNLTERFNELSFVDDPIGVQEKLSIFLNNYITYWSPDYLIIHGDPNLRHSTGHGGIIFSSSLILFLSSFPLLMRKTKRAKFTTYIVVSLLIAPIPAALITEGMPHALRSMLMGYYILLLSCYSIEWLLWSGWHCGIKVVILICLFITLLVEIVDYQLDYFLYYPPRSVEHFGSFDFKSAMEFALEHQPGTIVAVGLPPGGYANVQFYSKIVENQGKVPVEISDFTEPALGMCILFHRRTDVEAGLDAYSLPYDNFLSRSKLGPIEKIFNAEKFSGVIRVRCY